MKYLFVLSHIPPMVNPLIYGFRLDKMRCAIKGIIGSDSTIEDSQNRRTLTGQNNS